MTMPENTTLLLGGQTFNLDALSIKLDGDDLPALPPSDVVTFSFTSTIQYESIFDGLDLPLAAPPLVKFTQYAGKPTRQPFKATSGKSRSGRLMYGCRQLRQGFWMPAPTKLDRRRIRSWIAAFNRMYPPPVVKETTSFDALITGSKTKIDRDRATKVELYLAEVR